GPSTNFTSELRGGIGAPDWRSLPSPLIRTGDAAAGFLTIVAATEPAEIVPLLETAPIRTAEVDLRLARALVELDRIAEAQELLARIEADDPWEWRVFWYRGLCALAADET